MRTVPAVSSNTSPAGSSGCRSRSTTATTTPQMPMHHRMVILVVPTPPVIPALVTAEHLLALHLLAPSAVFMGVPECRLTPAGPHGNVPGSGSLYAPVRHVHQTALAASAKEPFEECTFGR